MHMKEMPFFNRPYEKIRRKGVSSLDDAELIAGVLVRGNNDENAVELSNRLLSCCNIHEFSSLSVHELKLILKDEVKKRNIFIFLN